MVGGENSQGGEVDLTGRRGLSFKGVFRWEMRGIRKGLRGARMDGKIGRSGSWATDAKKFAVKIRKRNWRGGSAASAQRLMVGLVRKAPRAIRRAENWIVFRSCREDLLDCEYIGAP